MKRSLFTFLLLPLLFACSKEKTAPSVPGISEPTITSQSRTAPSGGPKINSTLILDGANKGWCEGDASNCVILGGVDVKPSLKAMLDAAVNEDPTLVAAVFNTEESTVLNEYLGTDIVNGLRAGSYWLVKSTDNGRSATYLIGTTSAITAENMVLAFQIDFN